MKEKHEMWMELSLMFLLMVHHVIGLQITRSKDGDRVPGVFCEDGTLIFRDDETHSLQCITKMHEAGCELSFFDSRNVKCVEASGINEYHVIPRNVGTFCSDGHQVSPGQLQLQNYPNSIKKSVWYTGHGTTEVEKGVQYMNLQNTKVIFRITEYWPGFVMKLNFVCKNATGHVTEKPQENCIILKNVGFTPYPLEAHTFIPATLIPLITTTTTTLAPITKGAVVNQTIEKYQSLVKPLFSHDELIFALLCAFGLSFIIISICLTLLCIRYIRRQKLKGRSKGEGNEGFISEEAIEVVVASEEAFQISPHKKQKKKKILHRKKTKEKPNLQNSPPTTKQRASNETSPLPTTSPTLHFSPMVSTDSNRLSYSQANLVNAVEQNPSGSNTNLKENLNFGEGHRTHPGDITVTDDILNHYGPTTPRGFKANLLHQFTNDEHNVFHDNTEDDDHVYAQVHDRLSNDESPEADSVHIHTHREGDEENFQNIEEHSGFDQQDLYATVIRKKPDSVGKTLSELRHRYSSVSDGKSSSNQEQERNKENEDEEEVTMYLDEHSMDQQNGNDTTITLNNNRTINQDSYFGDNSSTNEEKDEQFSRYTRSSLKKVSKRSALWDRGHVQSPVRKIHTSNDESLSRKSAKEMWIERDSNSSSQDKTFSSPFRKKPNSVSSKYNRNKTARPVTSPKMSIRDIWKKRVDESTISSSPSRSIDRNNSVASRGSEPASITSMPAEDFVNEQDEANVDMSESIEAMFDMDEVTGGGSEEESFADILRKQMMF